MEKEDLPRGKAVMLELILLQQVNEFFSELDIEKSKQKKRLLESRFRVPRRKSILPSHLHSVMGSANLSLARGDVTGAIKLCLEVIRQGVCV